MARKTTPSFILELPLRPTAAAVAALETRFEAARHLYNACLDESLRRLALMRQSKDWQQARAMPKTLGRDAKGKPIPNKARTDLFRATIQRFGFTGASLQKFAESCRDVCWIGGHLGSHDTQTTSLRAFSAVQQHAFGKRGRPRFKGMNRLHSVEGKGDKVILFRWQGGRPVVLWNGLVLPVVLDPKDRDGWQQAALERRTKYVRVLRRKLRGEWRWYCQLVQEGTSPRKEHHLLGEGVVGLDIGPSTIAAVSECDATLEPFCPGVADYDAELRRVQRAMDRSLRATNPDHYAADGTVRPGPKRWTRSRRYRLLADRRADLERRQAATRKREHGELANRVLAHGDVVKTEKNSYRSFQKNFGRSVKRRAPSSFVSTLKRRAASAGASVVEFSTRTTRLSQFDHKDGVYDKKPLSQRWHVFSDGSRVQRDLYSAWLARFVTGDRLDASQLAESWAAAEPLLRRAASSFSQSATGTGFAGPHGFRTVGADRPSKPEGRARRKPQRADAPHALA